MRESAVLGVLRVLGGYIRLSKVCDGDARFANELDPTLEHAGIRIVKTPYQPLLPTDE